MDNFDFLEELRQTKIYLRTKKAKETKRRIRYKVPTYTKFYALYQYDREKFRNLLAEKRAGKNNYSQKEIYNMCIYLDELGNKKRDSDEVHIFRIRNLQKIHELLYWQLAPYKLIYPEKNGKIQIGNIMLYIEEEQAEIINTWQMTIKKRIKAHIKILKALRNGEITFNPL